MRAAGGSFVVDHRLPWVRAAGVLGNAKLLSFLATRLVSNPMSPFALQHRPALDSVSALDTLDPALIEFMVRPLTLGGAITEPEPTGVSLLHVLRLARIIVLTDYLVLPGGIASFHDALARRLHVELERPVAHLLEERGKIVGVALESGEVRAADRSSSRRRPTSRRASSPTTGRSSARSSPRSRSRRSRSRRSSSIGRWSRASGRGARSAAEVTR